MDILMPQLGETVAEGTVTNWYKKIGDAVKADEALFDVETDKVSTEIPSPIAGVLTEVLVAAGQTVKVGTRLAVVRAAGEQAGAPAKVREGRTDLGTVAPAQAGAQDSKSFLDSRPPTEAFGGRLRGNDETSYSESGAASASLGTHRDPQQRLSPVVRRLLAEHGIAAHEVHGTGRDGRITRDDVQLHIDRRASAAVAATTEDKAVPFVVARGPGATDEAGRGAHGAGAREPARPLARTHAAVADAQADASQALPSAGASIAKQARSPLPSEQGLGVRDNERVVPLNNIRRRSAAAMARAWQVVPHVLQAVEADYSRIEQARRAKGAAWQAREGFELTYLPFLAFAVCQALTRYDQLNSRIDGDTLIVSRRVHLGIAVDLNHEGLVAPAIRDAQDRNVPSLAREIRRLAIAARSNKLTPDDFVQPTYTISNSGVFGTLITAPIVNPPQVAILSTDGVSKRPVVVEGPEGDSIAVRPVGVLAQSFDHRAVDGAYSAAFLKELKRIVETRAWIDDMV
jgi:pyruvate dehydrogenase E2 component (dihydrolipoamide acetyltransferase)